jgi:lipopolysaccharide/colanic/teichoic acid biosynthesis glycosyltransferase
MEAELPQGRFQSAATEAPVRPNTGRAYLALKRAFDLISSLCLAAALFWLLIIVAIAIRLDSPGRAIFVQERSGKGGKAFKMYKFRSMGQGADKLRASMESQNELDGPAFKMADDPRVTRVGRFIRKTSIDELPQLLNIIKGDLSVVGPRPLPTYETERLSGRHRQRMAAKPGLLCYWQIGGRSGTAFDEWMEMDFKYINSASMATDMKILFKAIPAVFGRKGAF